MCVCVYVAMLNKLFTLLMKGLPAKSEEWGGAPAGHKSSQVEQDCGYQIATRDSLSPVQFPSLWPHH